MAELFRRKLSLEVGPAGQAGLKFNESFRVTFDVAKGIKDEVNSSEIRIYNLAESTRNFIEEGHKLRLSAGYVGLIDLIFTGDVRTASYKIEPPGGYLRIESGDGHEAMRKVTSFTMAKGAKPEQILAELQKQALGGIGKGFAAALKGIKERKQGETIVDTFQNACRDLLGAEGFDFSIQDGQFQVVKRGETTNESAYVLSAQTGMLASPEILEGGRIKVNVLCLPGLRPGRKLRVKSKVFKEGSRDFVIQRVQYVGDTEGQAWGATVEARPLKAPTSGGGKPTRSPDRELELAKQSIILDGAMFTTKGAAVAKAQSLQASSGLVFAIVRFSGTEWGVTSRGGVANFARKGLKIFDADGKALN